MYACVLARPCYCAVVCSLGQGDVAGHPVLTKFWLCCCHGWVLAGCTLTTASLCATRQRQGEAHTSRCLAFSYHCRSRSSSVGPVYDSFYASLCQCCRSCPCVHNSPSLPGLCTRQQACRHCARIAIVLCGGMSYADACAPAILYNSSLTTK
jgi:hypothetical protein